MNTLTSGDFTLSNDPFSLFELWMTDAEGAELNDPNAMTLATVDAAGFPNARIVLLKGMDRRGGFTFYTNTLSAKGQELDAMKRAALIFHWKSLRRQVRVQGNVERVSDQEADAYFATRPYGSRIGAHASLQSQELNTQETLKERFARFEERYPEGGPVPRPSHWTGYRVIPHRIEFWHDRPFRLHDRIVFSRSHENEGWRKERLYP